MAVIPILDNISAFDVNTGTTIRFSISGTGEFIRSSKVTFTDNDTGLDVATNIYSSVDLINVIPAHLQGIENGKQYSVRVDVYNTTIPTGESQGVSTAKPVWCLPTPDIIFTAPDETLGQSVTYISTSTYNFELLYKMYGEDDSSTYRVTNKIQSYKIDLYEGSVDSNVFVDSSNLIYGSGELVGDAEYKLSYAFNGLINNNSYYVVIHAYTEQGMEITDISTYIIPQLNETSYNAAEVLNDSCNGYITIRSNITNIVGHTNAVFIPENEEINLRNNTECVWGVNPYDGTKEYNISFPESEWSILMAARDFEYSIQSPLQNENYSESILYLCNYAKTEKLIVYARKDDVKGKIWFDVYVNEKLSNDTFYIVKSNEIDIPSSTTMVYILLSHRNGWYDIKISTEL